MIRYVRVDYAAPHRPGIPVIVCDANGNIVFERDGMEPTKRDRRKSKNVGVRKEVQQSVLPKYTRERGRCQCQELRA